MAETGRPTELTEELTLKIRERVLKGFQYIEIQKELEISPNTWDTWVYKDYQDFRRKLNEWKQERMVKKAEQKLDILMDSENEKVSLQASIFIAETLGKDTGYTKRVENTGKDGKDLIPQPILNNLDVHDHHGDPQDRPAL